MTIVSGLRIIDSNAQTGITWWNWTINIESDFQFKTYKLESKSDMALYKKMLSLFYIDGGRNIPE